MESSDITFAESMSIMKYNTYNEKVKKRTDGYTSHAVAEFKRKHPFDETKACGFKAICCASSSGGKKYFNVSKNLFECIAQTAVPNRV